MLSSRSGKRGASRCLFILAIGSLLSLGFFSVGYVGVFLAYNQVDMEINNLRAYPLEGDTGRFEITITVFNRGGAQPIVLRIVKASFSLNNDQLVFMSVYGSYNIAIQPGQNTTCSLTKIFTSHREVSLLAQANQSQTWAWKASFEITFELAFLEETGRSFSLLYNGNSAAPF